MLKFLQKSAIVSLMLGTALSANSQEIVDNFQAPKWTAVGWGTVTPDSTGVIKVASGIGDSSTTCTCETGKFSANVTPITVPQTYGATNVTYTITSGGVAVNCRVKGWYVTPTSPYTKPNPLVSDGYVSLNKNATAVTTDMGGSLVISSLPYIESIDISASATSSSKHFTVFASTDGGASWPVTVLDDNTVGKAGNMYYANTVQLQNVMLKIVAYEAIIRIHDLKIYTTSSTGIDQTTLLDNGAVISVSDNNVKVSSAPANGYMQIVNVGGASIGQVDVKQGTDASVYVPTSGLYVVRLVTNNQVLTKKIIIQ
jgi:hypothetical protein